MLIYPEFIRCLSGCVSSNTGLEDNMYIPMAISGITVDPLTNSPIVILKAVEGDQTLPIWIGLLEATAIASELEGIKFSRPMTHDLFRNMMEMVEIKVLKIEVCDLKNNTYYALIHFIQGEKEMTIDARPSERITELNSTIRRRAL
ncbi:MAG: bifunctional nuclease family protein [bacterium]